jgi:hypothetical protein
MITHINLNVKVLEIECMLPDVDPDDRDVSQKWVLVCGRDDLEALGRGVQTLRVKRREHYISLFDKIINLQASPIRNLEYQRWWR